MLAISAPEARVDADDDAFTCVEAEPESVVLLQVVDPEILATERHLAGVVEEGHVEARPDLEAVFALEQDRVRSAEAVFAEAAHRVVAAEIRLQVERNLVAVADVGCRGERAQCD